MHHAEFQSRSEPQISLFRSASLHAGEGATRGRAHVGYAVVPDESPAKLHLPGLLLVADGVMSPGEGVPMHEHAGIDNLTIVLEGQFRHEDHRGPEGTRIADAGDAALMASGAGGQHAEFAHGDAPLRALVVHFESGAPEAPCRFEHTRLDAARMDQGWQVIAGHGTVTPGAVQLSAPHTVSMTTVGGRRSRRLRVGSGRVAYVMSIDGDVMLGDVELGRGDRAIVRGDADLGLRGSGSADVRAMVIDLVAK